MARAATFLAILSVLAPGCSLAREVNGGGVDGGPHLGDAFVVRADTGVDAARPPVDTGVAPRDTGTPPIDMGTPPIDVGTPEVDAGHDAAVVVDAGGCRGDLDCPMPVITPGTCAYASACATTAMMMQTTTSYTCVDRVCVMHTAMMPAACTRTTEGTTCGAAPTCTACSATSCGGMGTMTCTGSTCQGGTCAPIATSMPCTTADNHCGTVSDWGFCTHDGIFSSTCSQSRSWGACVGDACVPFAGANESRSCSCPF